MRIGRKRHASRERVGPDSLVIASFQRRISRSTRDSSLKGSGRGLGAYSMKLLSERYLGGQVTFDTSPAEGTTFRAFYPL